MFRLDLGSTRRYCDGLEPPQLPATRRGRHGSRRPAAAPPGEVAVQPTSKNTSVILIWLDGGPGHMDMYDMKPDAPAEYRGIWKPIRTNVPGFDITELFPRQAKVADKFSIVRSLHHDTGDHFAGGHRMLTAKDMGVSGAEQRPASSLASAPIVNREVGPAAAGHARLRRPCRMPPASACGPATSAATCSGHAAQPVRDRRRPERAELPGARTSTWPAG